MRGELFRTGGYSEGDRPKTRCSASRSLPRAFIQGSVPCRKARSYWTIRLPLQPTRSCDAAAPSGRNFLHPTDLVGAAMCLAFECGSHDRWPYALRGSGPAQKPAFSIEYDVYGAFGSAWLCPLRKRPLTGCYSGSAHGPGQRGFTGRFLEGRRRTFWKLKSKRVSFLSGDEVPTCRKGAPTVPAT